MFGEFWARVLRFFVQPQSEPLPPPRTAWMRVGPFAVALVLVAVLARALTTRIGEAAFIAFTGGWVAAWLLFGVVLRRALSVRAQWVLLALAGAAFVALTVGRLGPAPLPPAGEWGAQGFIFGGVFMIVQSRRPAR